MQKQDALITSNAPATRGQMKQIGAMDEAALDGQGFTHAQLKFAQDEGKRYQRAFRKWFRKHTRDGLGIQTDKLMVVTDFDPDYEWNERVAAGNYNGVYIHSSFDPKKNLPVGQFVGVVEREVLLNQRSGYTTTQQWVDHVAALKPEQDFIHPFTLLQVGEDEPERQRKQWMLTIWVDGSGQFWYAILNEVNGDRNFNLSPVNPFKFNSSYLGVSSARKLPLAA
ncbi:MAG: hypothetical protein HYZ51_00925 [Candidatus Doudnabacteria bacterium]|nr:hypothetical protein [Candidatus Doudnabacteria bacterium]